MSNSAALISVIVPTHNRPEMLQKAIKSILVQTCRNFEIIVVNDAGVDVESIISELSTGEDITYVRHDSNKGPAAARNSGIAAARGKYIAYLDDDDTYYPDHLETLIDFLQRNAEYKVAYTDAYRAFYRKKGRGYTLVRKDKWSFDFDYDDILVGNFILNAFSVMHEKSCLETVGLFDEQLSTNEDWDMWIRMSQKFEFAHIRRITAEFSWRLDGSTLSSSKRADFVRTAELIYEKNRRFAEAKPALLKLQAANLEHLKKQRYGRWLAGERVKLALVTIIGFRGLRFLYKIKLIILGFFRAQ